MCSNIPRFDLIFSTTQHCLAMCSRILSNHTDNHVTSVHYTANSVNLIIIHTLTLMLLWLKRPKRAGKSRGQCSVVRWYMMKKRQWRTLLLLSSWPYPTPLEWAASPQRMFWKWSVRQPAVREELLIPSPGNCPLLWGSLCCLQMKSWLNLMTTVLLVQNILHKLKEALDTSPQWVVKLV